MHADVAAPARVGAYHSLTARLDDFPADVLTVMARNETGLVMALQHKTLPIAAVQFHPESILSLGQSVGHTLIGNVVRQLAFDRTSPEPALAN